MPSFHLSEIISLVLMVLFLGVFLVGFILCLLNLRLSRWLTLAGVGFLGEALVTVASRLANFLLPHLSVSSSSVYGLIYAIVSLLGLLAGGCVVLGLALAFADARRRLRRLEDGDDFDRGRFAGRPDVPVVGPARPTSPGSENIQQ